jgi:chorismate mutase
MADRSDLVGVRAEIEAVDDAIVALIAHRMRLARAAARIKRSVRRALVDPGREREVLQRAAARGRAHGLEPEAIRELFRQLIAIARQAQGAGADHAPAARRARVAELR